MADWAGTDPLPAAMPARRRHLVAALCALCALAAPALAHASAIDLFGYGARGMAMGGAVAASVAGHAAVYYNPARLAFDDQLSFAVGYQRAAISLEAQGEDWPALDAPALSIGFGIPIPFGGVMEDRLTLGLGFVLPQTSILIADTKRPGDLTWVLAENRAQTVSIQGALGVRITDWLSVGWGMVALAELQGAITVEPNEAGNLGSQAGDELVTDYASIVGLAARPHERLWLGLVWRQASTADYALPIEVDLGDAFPLPVPTLEIGGTAQYDPQQVTFAASFAAHERVSVDVAGTWKDWSAFPNPIQYTAVPDAYPEQPEPGFSDTVVLRVGTEASLPVGEVTVLPRAGFVYEPTPVPEQRGLHNYLDADRVIPSLGVGATWGPLSLDVAGQVHIYEPRRHAKDACVQTDSGVWITPLPDGAGIAPTYPDGNPGCPDGVRHAGHMTLLAVELGVRF